MSMDVCVRSPTPSIVSEVVVLSWLLISLNHFVRVAVVGSAWNMTGRARARSRGRARGLETGTPGVVSCLFLQEMQ